MYLPRELGVFLNTYIKDNICQPPAGFAGPIIHLNVELQLLTLVVTYECVLVCMWPQLLTERTCSMLFSIPVSRECGRSCLLCSCCPFKNLRERERRKRRTRRDIVEHTVVPTAVNAIYVLARRINILLLFLY